MNDSPLRGLEALGQSVWIDLIRRGMITSGQLEQLVEQDGVSGVTSNPSIFEKAIAASRDYDTDIRSLAMQGRSAEQIYEALAVRDIQMTADLLRPTYDQGGGQDGFVSLEVSPLLAHDTRKTVEEARRLWKAVDRPNLLIKVPATREGLPAISELIGEGINVNVTLLFGIARYREVAEAYRTGLEILGRKGVPLARVTSVASFFLSRIDTLVDPLLEKKLQSGGTEAALAFRLRGQVAIAQARAAYDAFKEMRSRRPFSGLEAQGARPQRLLWASTSTKNPAYSDVKYVEALIGPHTVTTLPLEALNAFRDHGAPRLTLEEGIVEAQETLSLLPRAGVDMEKVSQILEAEGVAKFTDAYLRIIATLDKRCAEVLRERADRQSLFVGGYAEAVDKRLRWLAETKTADRLWRKDPTLWSDDRRVAEQMRGSLGWLSVAESMHESVGALRELAAEVKTAGYARAVVLGMGGSSLTASVLARTFAPGKGGIPVDVLDTTDPSAVVKAQAQPGKTLFIVSSKSGTTAETAALDAYFWEKQGSGKDFIAITDPGTKLAENAKARRFRGVFPGFPGIGGRYSALSPFGIVPAAIMGLDVSEFLDRSLAMAHACASCVPADENPGIGLGAAIAELRDQGRDKLTFLIPPGISALGTWLEQLLAESTGKEGNGILPVVDEPIGSPEVYGKDRLFVLFHLEEKPDETLEKAAVALRDNGHPVVSILVEKAMDIGQEFFRWEFAVAVAGTILGINPFDQPNVQEAKDTTNRLLGDVRREGRLPEREPDLVEGNLGFYGKSSGNAAATVRGFLSQARQGDYFAILSYLPEDPGTNQALQAVRRSVRDQLRIATTVGVGPRYLHSTGQYHKGGPNTGLFLMLTADDGADAPIPGERFGFSAFKRAQALGDLETLQKHGRRVMRVDLGRDVQGGLFRLRDTLRPALETL